METFMEMPELVALLMDHIDRGGHYPRHGNHDVALSSQAFRMTLLACAHVNRLFSQEALRLLWNSLDDLNPLLDLLPLDATTIYSGEKYISRQLIQHDWERINCYAPLVRNVTVRPEDGGLVSAYRDNFPHQILFPRLVSLDFRSIEPAFLHAFLPATLQNVHVYLSWWSMNPSEKTDAFKALGTLPDLRVLEVDGGFKEICHQVSPELNHLLQGAFKLTELDLSEITITPTQLRLLQFLPTLQVLAFATENIIPKRRENPSPPSQVVNLIDLQKLVLYGRVGQVTHVISYLGLHPRKYLRIGTTFLEPSPSKFEDLFHAIGDLPESLEVLIIETEPYGYNTNLDDFNIDEDQEVIPASSLNPLLNFRKLKRLDLEVDHLIDLCDDDIPNISNAFPDIEHLVLSYNQARLLAGTKTRITPSSLIHFAKDTPKLKNLSLFINSDWIPYPSFHPSFHSSSSLEWLDVGLSKIMDDDHEYNENDVCFILAELFPSLQYINWSLPFGMTDGEEGGSDITLLREVRRRKFVGQIWDTIESMLPQFQTFRCRAQQGVSVPPIF